jgi:hypothetical protein
MYVHQLDATTAFLSSFFWDFNNIQEESNMILTGPNRYASSKKKTHSSKFEKGSMAETTTQFTAAVPTAKDVLVVK